MDDHEPITQTKRRAACGSPSSPAAPPPPSMSLESGRLLLPPTLTDSPRIVADSLTDDELQEALELETVLLATESALPVDIVRAKMLDAEVHFVVHLPSVTVDLRQRLEFRQRWLASERFKIGEKTSKKRSHRGKRAKAPAGT